MDHAWDLENRIGRSLIGAHEKLPLATLRTRTADFIVKRVKDFVKKM